MLHVPGSRRCYLFLAADIGVCLFQALGVLGAWRLCVPLAYPAKLRAPGMTLWQQQQRDSSL
jgi:hypothetical protein